MFNTLHHGQNSLDQAISVYYDYNPDTLMPLLMLALAAQGKLEVDGDSEKGTTEFASVSVEEVLPYEWVKLNPKLKQIMKKLASEGVRTVAVRGDVPSELEDIYKIFHKYDTETVVQEYHHRKGILVQHSSHAESDRAQRQYATICMAEEFAYSSQEYLKENFLSIANDLLVKSGIQPERPRLRVAEALCTLLNYDGEGIVYNPFAGCAFAGAMIGSGGKLYADGDKNEKLLAIARLLCYGTGQKEANIKEEDSRKWRGGIKPDYVMSTYTGYVDGKSAFDFCLAQCLDSFQKKGRYAGIAAPRDIFEKQSPEFKEALKRDWIDTIVLLPFGEVAVLVDAVKETSRKKKVCFYNMTHPMISCRPDAKVIDDDYVEILKLSDVKKKGFLKSLVTPEIDQLDGYEIITLGDIYEKVPRQTWSLSRVPEEDRILASIDRDQKYEEWENPWMQGIEKNSIACLFAPSYKITENCLIVNSKGSLEPRLFDADGGNAFFQDGFAFREKFPDGYADYHWLVHELCNAYVERQLHPYGMDNMVPESFTEDQVLSLKLYRPIISEEEYDDLEFTDPEEYRKRERAKYSLKPNTIIHGGNVKYTIHRYLGAGSFGYTYTALSENLANGQQKEIVLKEFFPEECYTRDNLKAVEVDEPRFDLAAERVKFHEESLIMGRLGAIPDSHIVPAGDFFECPETATPFYTMPFYQSGSIEDNNDLVYSEKMTIKQIVVPMCKALYIAHREKVLHLDIKPENIIIDNNGDAILIDFGVAKQYDEMGNILKRLGTHGTSPYAAPEMRVEQRFVAAHFGPQPDIFGLAASIYKIVTGDTPRPIEYLSDFDKVISNNIKSSGYSEQFASALVMGLQAAAPARPKDAQAFLNMFPGCENIAL